MRRSLIIYCFLFWVSATLRAETILVPPGEFSIDVGPHTSVWIDESNSVEMPEVQSSPFEPNPQGNLTFGFKRSTIWVRFGLKNPGTETRDLRFVAASPLVEDVVLYAISQGTVSVQTGGSNRRFADRQIQYAHLTFPLQLRPGEEIHFLLRARSELRTDFPFILQSTGTFARKQTRELLIHGFYFGILFVAIAYNVVLFLSIRDWNFAIYVVYVILFGFTLSCHTGFAFQYLWPDSVWWNKHSHTFFSAMIGFSMCLFCYFFLDLRTQAPRLGLLILIPGALAGLVGIISLSGFLFELAKINNALLILSTSLVYAAGWRVWAQGYKPARFFLLSFSLVIVTGIILLLGARGLIAVPPEVTYVVQLGSALEIILLSLGLGDRINVMRARTDLLEKEALRRETEIKQMEMELGIARQIQQSILPQGAPVLNGLRVAARYEPMQAVGGDFYDFYPVSDSMLCVLIADVSGHGIPAALIASMLKIAGAENVSRAESPAEFLLAINRVILGKQSDHFVTAGFGVIDISKRKLTYANAGHPPLLIQSKTGAIRRLRPPGRILGIFPNPSFAHETVDLLDGDRILFYTDGIIEASGEDFVQFSQERVELLMTEFINRSPEELSDALLRRLHDWTGATSLDDDVTFVIVDIGPEAGAIAEETPDFI